MKLISKTLLFYLLISLPLLAIAGFFSYKLILHELKDAGDEALWKEKASIEKVIKQNSRSEFISNDNLNYVYLVKDNSVGFNYEDTIVFDSLVDEEVKYRALISYFNIKGQNYKIKVAKPTMEEDELIEGLLSAFAVIAGFLVLALFVANLVLSKTLWKPFYQTLEKLNSYELKNHIAENFEKSSTMEFNNLNITLNNMTNKIHSDFLQQKEFTENASHEMQTPLAIIKANLGLLMQSSNIQLEEMNHIQSIDDTTKKLSSLNKALLLLAKIDNNQFKEIIDTDIRNVMNKVLLHFEDLVEAKQINLVSKIHNGIPVLINPVLADILLTNLFQNAIRHNFNKGEIRIEITGNALIISNSGEPLRINENELFTRFKKNEASKDSLGLGLAIVKSICVLYKINLNYYYSEGLHNFSLSFNDN